MSTNDAHVTKVNEIARSNGRLIVREIAKGCNISVGSRHVSRRKDLECTALQ